MSTVLTNEELTQYIGTISESLNTKVDTNMNNVGGTSGFRKLIEIYNNGTSWYKVYAEYNPSTGAFVGNWCEQGGIIGDGTYTQHSNVVVYLKQLNTTFPLYINVCPSNGTYNEGDTSNRYGDVVANMSSTGFSLRINQYSRYVYWKAEGYIS